MPHCGCIWCFCVHPAPPGLAVQQLALDGGHRPGHCAQYFHGRAWTDCRSLDLQGHGGLKGLSHGTLDQRCFALVCGSELCGLALLLCVAEQDETGQEWVCL